MGRASPCRKNRFLGGDLLGVLALRDREFGKCRKKAVRLVLTDKDSLSVVPQGDALEASGSSRW